MTILLNSPTFGEALNNLCRYYHLLSDAITPVLSVESDSVMVGLDFPPYEIPYYRHAAEAHLSYYHHLFTRLTDDKFKLDRVDFIHPSPLNTAPHQDLFGAPVYFSQRYNRLIFNQKILNSPVFISNPELLKALKKHANEILGRIYTSNTFASRVEKSIIELLPTGKSDIDTIATKLAMSKRNLQYKLKHEGTTYKTLLDKMKKNQAAYFLEKTDISIVDVAFLLGYTEQSTFNRAFKKWTGRTPREFRLQTNLK